jgi:hypothetical protein
MMARATSVNAGSCLTAVMLKDALRQIDTAGRTET